MRKFMYAALAGVFMLSSGFSSKETANFVKNDSEDFGGSCWYLIKTTVQNPDGSTGTQYNYINSYASSESHCQQQASAASFSPYSDVGLVYYSEF